MKNGGGITRIGLILSVHLAVSVVLLRAEGVREAGAEVELLSDGFLFTEGPAVDSAGNVFFTDQPNDRIMKWGIDGKLSLFLQPSGRSNGLYFDREGWLLACADEQNQLWRIGSDGKHEVLLEGFDGRLLNGPNDLWVDPQNGIYFTDPFYKRPYWNRGEMEQTSPRVYYLSPGRKKVSVADDGLVQPNGIVGTPDGKTLYVADIGDHKTYAYQIQGQGSLSDRQVFCEMGSDGMTLDEEGNLYLTGEGVTVFDPTGKRIDQIDVPQPWTANVCFGGADRKTLFITASKELYALKMGVAGAR